METLVSFRKLFTYDHWANHEVLAALNSPKKNEQALRFLAHIIGAQQIWLARLKQEDTASIPVWPTLTLPECRTLVDDLKQIWSGFLDGLTPEMLPEKVTYQNTQGVQFESPIQDILMHIIMHSAYHRGQIATTMREAGETPAVTDYIAFVRRTI